MAHAFQGMACPVMFLRGMACGWSFNVQQFKWGWCPAQWAYRNVNWYVDIREVRDNEFVDTDFTPTPNKASKVPEAG